MGFISMNSYPTTQKTFRFQYKTIAHKMNLKEENFVNKCKTTIKNGTGPFISRHTQFGFN